MDKFTTLKNLAEQKLRLEKENKMFTNEYEEHNNRINEFLVGLTKTDDLYCKKMCEQEYKQFLGFFGSDIADAQAQHMQAKFEVNAMCSELLSRPKQSNPNAGMEK